MGAVTLQKVQPFLDVLSKVDRESGVGEKYPEFPPSALPSPTNAPHWPNLTKTQFKSYSGKYRFYGSVRCNNE